MPELANLPAQGPATLGGVRAFLRYPVEGDTADDPELETIVDAVNALVRTWPVCADSQLADGATQAELDAAAFTANVVRGANMMAGRLFRRRESPAGVAAFGEMGPVYVMRNDPDVAMLLQLGPWERPGVL